MKYKMSEKYQNKYRIPSTRLQNWDYGANGACFITICTANRVQYFGEIENCQMQLTQLTQLGQLGAVAALPAMAAMAV